MSIVDTFNYLSFSGYKFYLFCSQSNTYLYLAVTLVVICIVSIWYNFLKDRCVYILMWIHTCMHVQIYVSHHLRLSWAIRSPNAKPSWIDYNYWPIKLVHTVHIPDLMNSKHWCPANNGAANDWAQHLLFAESPTEKGRKH